MSIVYKANSMSIVYKTKKQIVPRVRLHSSQFSNTLYNNVLLYS
jgi:hypothetical protein